MSGDQSITLCSQLQTLWQVMIFRKPRPTMMLIVLAVIAVLLPSGPTTAQESGLRGCNMACARQAELFFLFQIASGLSRSTAESRARKGHNDCDKNCAHYAKEGHLNWWVQNVYVSIGQLSGGLRSKGQKSPKVFSKGIQCRPVDVTCPKSDPSFCSKPVCR